MSRRPPTSYSHLSGDTCLADPKRLLEKDLWWEGPPRLSQLLPPQTFILMVICESPPSSDIWCVYSSWRKLVWTVARMLRFISHQTTSQPRLFTHKVEQAASIDSKFMRLESIHKLVYFSTFSSISVQKFKISIAPVKVN